MPHVPVTVGRSVHYYSGPGRNSPPRAAVVTAVYSQGVVSLHCFDPMPACPSECDHPVSCKNTVRFCDKDNPDASPQPTEADQWPGDYGWCEYPPVQQPVP